MITIETLKIELLSNFSGDGLVKMYSLTNGDLICHECASNHDRQKAIMAKDELDPWIVSRFEIEPDETHICTNCGSHIKGIQADIPLFYSVEMVNQLSLHAMDTITKLMPWIEPEQILKTIIERIKYDFSKKGYLSND